jgi:hypothetical protein
MIQKLYHGCSAANVEEVMKNIKVTARGFHMTPDIEIAKEYGSKVVCFEVEPFESHVGTLNKGGGFEEDIKSGIEYVLKNEYHLVSFYKNLEDLYVV